MADLSALAARVRKLPEDRQGPAWASILELELAGIRCSPYPEEVPGRLDVVTNEQIAEAMARLPLKLRTVPNAVEVLGGDRRAKTDKKKVEVPLKSGQVPGIKYNPPVRGSFILLTHREDDGDDE